MSGIGEKIGVGARFDAGLIANAGVVEEIKAPAFEYLLECFDSEGNLKWSETIRNLVTSPAKNDILDKYFAGSAYTASWNLGLKGSGSAAVGDTLASHAGWSEVTPYAGNRPAIAFGAASGGSKAGSAIAFTINAGATVAGAFICAAASGTAGVLYSAGDFAAARTVASGDTLNVTPTVTAS